MAILTVSYLKNEGLVVEESGKFVCTKEVTGKAKEGNQLFYVKETDRIIQINADYTEINCFGYNKQYRHINLKADFSKEQFLDLVKGIISSGNKYYFNSNDSETEQYMEDLGFGYFPKMSQEDIFQILDEEYDSLFGGSISIVLSKRRSMDRISFYNNGVISYDSKECTGNIKEDGEKIIREMDEYNHMVGSDFTLHRVEFKEYNKVKHPMSELYILVGYLKENKELLPEHVQKVLSPRLESELGKLGDVYKNKEVYDK